jgi:hypothetical protein
METEELQSIAPPLNLLIAFQNAYGGDSTYIFYSVSASNSVKLKTPLQGQPNIFQVYLLAKDSSLENGDIIAGSAANAAAEKTASVNDEEQKVDERVQKAATRFFNANVNDNDADVILLHGENSRRGQKFKSKNGLVVIVSPECSADKVPISLWLIITTFIVVFPFSIVIPIVILWWTGKRRKEKS